VIYKGLKPGVTREAFARHIRDNTVVNDLVAVPVKAGDCHYLPSGTCHALGAGILVAEVQTPSDTTFRVYDWGRPASAGRELHVEQALECIDFDAAAPARIDPPIPNKRQGLTTTRLTRTEFFEIERVDADAGSGFQIVPQGRPEVWMMLDGRGEIRGDAGHAVELRRGMTILVPAAARAWQASFEKRTWLLCVRLPSPLRNLIV
jgi:mannose-6-phosphate isomerase